MVPGGWARGNTGERTVSFFRFRERVGIHTSAQHVTTLLRLEERGMRDHTMCRRLLHIYVAECPECVTMVVLGGVTNYVNCRP